MAPTMVSSRHGRVAAIAAALVVAFGPGAVAAAPEPSSPVPTAAIPCGTPAPPPHSIPDVSSEPRTSPAASVAPGASAALLDIGDIISPSEPPIDLAVTTECDSTVTATVPIEGGEIVTTGADGTVYTLTIPGDALLSETTVSMTPVGSVDGLPTSGEVIYAVQLEPSGLELYDFATLTIAPADDLPIDQQIPFGYEGSGEGMFVAFPADNEPGIRLKLLHFSGYGVTKGYLADLEPVRQRLGGDAEARLASQTALELGAERQRALLGTSGPDDLEAHVAAEARAMKVFDDVRDQVLAPRLLAAGESCANGRLAAQTVVTIQRQQGLLGMESMEWPAGLTSLIGHVCMQEEYELCRDEHIIHRIKVLVTEGIRQRVITGQEDPGETAFAQNLARKCLTFELDFESSTRGSATGMDVRSNVESRVKLTMDPDTFVISGKAPLKNTKFKVGGGVPGCSMHTSRGGSKFRVSGLTWTITDLTTANDLGGVKDFQIALTAEPTTESVQFHCPHAPVSTMAGPYWFPLFDLAHANEQQADGTYKMIDWKVRDRSERVGTKDWEFDKSGSTEDGSVTLRHTPQ